MLNNLFEVCWKWKNADIICYKLTPLVSLIQKSKIPFFVKNPKKWWESIKIANIDREIFHIFWTAWEISMKFSEKMWLWLVIILKVTKSQCFTLSLEDIFFKKPRVGEGQIDVLGRERDAL